MALAHRKQALNKELGAPRMWMLQSPELLSEPIWKIAAGMLSVPSMQDASQRHHSDRCVHCTSPRRPRKLGTTVAGEHPGTGFILSRHRTSAVSIR